MGGDGVIHVRWVWLLVWAVGGVLAAAVAAPAVSTRAEFSREKPRDERRVFLIGEHVQ